MVTHPRVLAKEKSPACSSQMKRHAATWAGHGDGVSGYQARGRPGSTSQSGRSCGPTPHRPTRRAACEHYYAQVPAFVNTEPGPRALNKSPRFCKSVDNLWYNRRHAQHVVAVSNNYYVFRLSQGCAKISRAGALSSPSDRRGRVRSTVSAFRVCLCAKRPEAA
jgi:hypothetical protein